MAACPRCGGGFECGAEQGRCDCFDIRLSPAQQATIAARWSDCLCLQCLREFAQGAGHDAPCSTASPPPSSS